MMKTLLYRGETLTLKKNEYYAGGVALTLSDEYESPFATATVWVPGLKQGEVAIKDYAENEGMLAAMVDAGVVHPPHRYVKSGFVTIPVCKLKEDN